MFDVSMLAVADTADIHILGPDRSPLYADANKTQPCIITIYGPGSPQAAAEAAARNARNLELMQQAVGGKLELSADEQAKQRLDKLVARTAGMENLSHADAAAAQGLAGLARAIYSDRRIGFIAQYIESVMDDWSRFLPKSPTN
jgi:hypothetical protein